MGKIKQIQRMITSREAVQNENALYVFKKRTELKTVEASTLCLYADARYKLYINGTLAAIGPCRRSSEVGYYDKVDITPYLRVGTNEFEVRVLQLAVKPEPESWLLLESVMRNGNLALCIWGNLGTEAFGTDESWVCAKEENVRFGFEQGYRNYNAVQCYEFTSADYGKELRFLPAVMGGEIYNLDSDIRGRTISPNPVTERPIPMMYFAKKEFVNETNGVYDAGYETCGYVRLRASGKGEIKLTYTESKVFMENGKRYKRRRDAEDGIILGDCDRLKVDGALDFETFWMRTFRYIQIETEGEVCIDSFDFLETGYPLTTYDDYDFGNETDNKVFAVSVNTLRRCMHETYVDCPYYEQLQYTMDTNQQMLFTYQLTQDRALPEKAIDDFAKSYRVGGLTQSRFPTNTVQFIPGFSLFLIYMLHIHAKRFGDKSFIRKYIHVADGTLQWFEEHMDGYMVARTNLWDFIDWPKEFVDGCYPEYAPMSVYSMMLADALEKTAELHAMLGNSVPSYTALAKKIKADVKARCYDEATGLYADTPLKGHFSQHQQFWAVLCGMETGEAAKQLLLRSEQLSCKAMIAYNYYRLRAYEQVGMYDKADEIMDTYRGLVALGCTTMPEHEREDVRSECHAWSAIALYEFTAKVLGVTYADGKIYVKPHIGSRPYAKGTVATPVGGVYVSWKQENGTFEIELKLPEGEAAILTMPDGKEMTVQSGTYSA